MSPQIPIFLSGALCFGVSLPAEAGEPGKPVTTENALHHVKLDIEADMKAAAARPLMLEELAEQSGWMKVYAAEWFLEAGRQGDPAVVRRIFLAVERAGPHSGTEQVGIWRVLAQAAESEAERAGWVERLTGLFLTPEEPRRLHAVETLCKLGEVSPEVAQSARAWMSSAPETDEAKKANEANAPFCWWSIALSKGASEAEKAEAITHLKQQLGATASVVRIRAAFALGQLAKNEKSENAENGAGSLRPGIAEALRTAVAGEVTEAALKHHLQCALFLSSSDEKERAALRESLLADLFTTPNSARLIAATLGDSLSPSMAAELSPRLFSLMESENFHHRWAAARLLAARPWAVAANTALQAEPQPEASLRMRHQKHVNQAKAGNIDLLFFGDSITQYWSDPRYGQKVWDKEFLPLKAANFGVAGDRIQHMLWRLRNGEGEGFSPKAIVLLAGTNNVSFERDGRTPRNEVSEVIAGLEGMVAEIRQRFPESRLLILGILPRGKSGAPVRSRVAMVNSALSKLHDGTKLFYLDIGEEFLNEDDEIPADVMPDALHPNEKGYEIFTRAIKPTLIQWLPAAEGL